MTQSTGMLDQLKATRNQPALVGKEKSFDEAVSQLENFAGRPEAQGITPGQWQAIMAIIMQIISIFINPPAPVPPATPKPPPGPRQKP